MKVIEKCGRREGAESYQPLSKAGYMEDWKYHKTFSGTPRGVLSPLANIFLHQLDDYMIKELDANKTQTKWESNLRRNPECRKIENKITRLRKTLKEGKAAGNSMKS
jgi:hypothetical protein